MANSSFMFTVHTKIYWQCKLFSFQINAVQCTTMKYYGARGKKAIMHEPIKTLNQYILLMIFIDSDLLFCDKGKWIAVFCFSQTFMQVLKTSLSEQIFQSRLRKKFNAMTQKPVLVYMVWLPLATNLNNSKYQIKDSLNHLYWGK